jgi:hypothetical protein
MVDFAPPEVSAPCRRQPCHKQAGRTNSGIASALRTASETASGRASRLPNRRGQSNPIPVSRIASRNNRAHTDKHSALRRETGYESAKESKPWTRTPDEQNFRHVIRDSGPARFQSGRPSWPNTLSYETCPFWFTASPKQERGPVEQSSEGEGAACVLRYPRFFELKSSWNQKVRSGEARRHCLPKNRMKQPAAEH